MLFLNQKAPGPRSYRVWVYEIPWGDFPSMSRVPFVNGRHFVQSSYLCGISVILRVGLRFPYTRVISNPPLLSQRECNRYILEIPSEGAGEPERLSDPRILALNSRWDNSIRLLGVRFHVFTSGLSLQSGPQAVILPGSPFRL